MSGVNGKTPVYAPGGGGGGGAGPNKTGGNGAAGQVEIVFSAAAAPSWNVVRFMLSVPSTGDTDGAVVAQFQTNGTVAKCQVIYNTASGGSLTMKGLASGGGTLFTTSAITGINNLPVIVSMELNTSGSTIRYQLQVLDVAGAAFATGFTTLGGANVIGTVSEVDIDVNSNLANSSVGHIIVQYAIETITFLTQSLIAWVTETAGGRFLRLCQELGIPATLIGSIGDTVEMGPQINDTPINVLQQTEDLDRGLLFESLNQFGMAYRTYKSMTNQSPAVTVDYSLAQISPPFQPTEDDLLTRNDVTVTQYLGSSYRLVQTTGPMSNQDPPNGVGAYTYAITVNSATFTDIAAVAAKIIALGTVDEYRYPVITFDLTRPEVYAIFVALRAMGVGDHLQIINPPSFLTQQVIDQLAFGFTITIQGRKFLMGMNCVPESPFEV